MGLIPEVIAATVAITCGRAVLEARLGMLKEIAAPQPDLQYVPDVLGLGSDAPAARPGQSRDRV